MFLPVLAALAQAQTSPRLPKTINEASLVRLTGTVHPRAIAANDAGRASGDLVMNRMLLVLKATPAQDAALSKLIADQHDPSSANYRQWLTPEQFAEKFAPAQADVETIVKWLQTKGFEVGGVARGRRSIEFSGAAGQVEKAFRTEMRHYTVEGVKHLANSTDIAVPLALADIVAGVEALNDFHPKPMHEIAPLPSLQSIPATTAMPLFNAAGGAHAVAPGDFATIYNVAPLYGAGIDGTGQTVAVVGRTNFAMSDVATFRSMFGLPGNNTQIVLNGADPGIVSQNEEVEALLDTQWSGAVAKNATIRFVLSANTNTTGGETLSAEYIVNNNLAPVLTMSFGLCESLMGPGNGFYNALWQQAAAQGISVLVSSGDSGSAGCDSPGSTSPAIMGLGVSGIASTPFNTAVGGTQLNENGSPSIYWSASNNATDSTALSYIPEMVWNDSSYGGAGNSANNLYAGSGGVSTIYATPPWQSGSGVPAVDPNTANRHHRYIPDMSLSAASHDPYIVVLNGGLIGVAGTSGGAPSFAGIIALLNQHDGARVGNPAANLYSLAAQYPSAFHDVVTGSDAVPCAIGSPSCNPGANGAGTISGWNAAAGYDLATGLGSVNAYNLVMNWPSGTQPTPPAITSLAPNPMTGSPSNQTLIINGSAFQNGLKVILTSSGSPVTYQGAQVSSVTGSQIQVAVNVGVGTAAWTVQVVNPNGQSSNSASLTVNPPAQGPTVTSLNPNPLTGSNSAQTVTINGSGFQSGAGLEVHFRSSTVTYTLQSAQITYVSSSQLQVSITTGTSAAAYSVTVINPGGLSSAPVNFVINSPTQQTVPAIASFNPAALARSTVNQTLLINGSGFQNGTGLKVMLSYNGYSLTLSAPQVTWLSNAQIQAVVNVGTSARTLGVQVVNPNGQASNLAAINVQ